MRIAMMTPHTGTVDGVQWAAHHMTVGLTRRGHTVDLLYQHRGGNHRSWTQETWSQVELPAPLMAPWQPVLAARTARILYRAARTSRWDAVCAHRLDMVNAGAVAASVCRSPLVLYLHNDPPPWFHPRKLSIAGWRTVDWLLTPSEYTRRHWVSAGVRAERSSVLPYGVDAHLFRPLAEAERRTARQARGLEEAIVIAYIGRLESIKGVHVLMEAFRLYAEREPRAKLLLVGGVGESVGRSGEAYVQSLRNLAIKGRTIWWGATNDVPGVLQICDLVVIPSLWQEPGAVSAIESLTAGVPVLASCSGGMPEHFGGGLEDLIFEQNSAAAIVAKLVKYAHWRTTMPNLGARVRLHAIRHRSLERSLRQAEQLLAALSRRPSATSHAT